MFPLITLSLFEIAVLLGGAIILGCAIYFFIVSQRSLKQTLEKTNQKVTLRPGFYGAAPAVKPERQIETVQEEKKQIKASYIPAEPVVVKSKAIPKEDSIDSLKETVLQQQKLLSSFLRQVEEIENEGREELQMQNKHLHDEIKTLEVQ